jgi:hypothetical protein
VGFCSKPVTHSVSIEPSYRHLQGKSNPAAGVDINFIHNSVETPAPSNPFIPDRSSLLLRCHHKEVARDRNRRVLGIMFKEKLLEVFREIHGADYFLQFSYMG